MRKLKIKILLPILLTASFVYSQNSDSLFEAFVRMKTSGHPNLKGFRTASLNYHYEKCGLGLIIKIRENIDKFTPQQRDIIEKAMLRPSLQTSIVSPSGKYRIHYDTVGVNKPGFSVRWFANILDSVYRFEVLKLGYPFPPADGKRGGDGKYDFYIENLPAGLYGATTPDSSLGGGKFTAYTEIDNNFLASEGYYSTGKAGAEVTAAHEFHHAIQIGDYINRYSQDGFYYEITSTAMEEFTFDDVNDYYYYMKSYFNRPDLTLSQNDGYNLAILNIFLQKRFDFSLLKRIWELMINNRAIEAIALAVAERGSSFANEFNEFGVWCFFTSYRANPATDLFFDYDEAKNYPIIKPSTTIEFRPPKKTVNLNTNPVANMYLCFPDFSRGVSDTLFAIVTNADVESGVYDKKKIINLKYSLLSSSEAGAKRLNNFYYYSIESAEKSLLKISHIFNQTPVADSLNVTEMDYAYPQPFHYSKNDFIFLPAPSGSGNEAELSVFSASMTNIFHGQVRVYSIDKTVVRWKPLDRKGKKLPSGIYLFVLSSNGKTKKGKLVIWND